VGAAGPPTAPARRRIRADAVVTVDGEGRVLRPGVLDLEGDRLVWVGPAADAPPPPEDVDDVGGLLVPGFVNTHGHSAMTLLRGVGDGLPLDRWLTEAVWPAEARLTDDDVRWGTLLGCHELLTCGVTTTCEQYLHHRAVADALVESGMRAVALSGVVDLPGAGPEGSWQHFLADAVALHDDLDGVHPTLTLGFGPHSAYSLPTEALVAAATAATERGALLGLHLAETATEGDAIAAEHGCSVPALLERLGVLGGPVLAAHAVWLDDADLDRLARHDVAVAHCPASNGKLGSGVARVPEMLARGLRVGLGTDGPGSNNDLDLFEDMRLAAVLARATAADPGALSTTEALHLATRGGADALGLAVGALEAGRRADVVRLELDDGRFLPDTGDDVLVAHLVWAASSRLVTDVWVGGRRVVERGRCTTIDPAAVRHEVRRRSARLVAPG